MHYQMVEDLLRNCILLSYEILNASSHEKVTYKPSQKHLDDIRKRKGLGGLVDVFETLTHHKDLCARIKQEAANRNIVAHRAAADYLQFPLSKDGAEECFLRASDIDEFATKASWLYEDLYRVHEEIEKIHGEIV